MADTPLTDDELARYARHIVLPEIGGPGQRKLKQARVLVIGAGGLGAPVLLYLAAAGVGTLGVVDDDVVSLSNLQRQIIHDSGGIGRSKTSSAVEALGRLNDNVTVAAHELRLKPDNASKAANAMLCRVLLLLSNIETSISGYGERHTGGSPAQPQRMTAHNHNSDSSEAIHTLQSVTPITSRCR